MIFKDAYIWLPFEYVEKIEFFKPKTLRDLYWIQANVELTNGTNGEMFFPALYAGSWKHENDAVRLGRMTDWRDMGEELYVGEGLKLFWMDGRDRPILELETIEFKHEEEAEADATLLNDFRVYLRCILLGHSSVITVAIAFIQFRIREFFLQ